MDDDNIRRLNIRYKEPPKESGPVLKVVQHDGSCNHEFFFTNEGEFIGGRMVEVTYIIREGETEVGCGHCNARLDPMWVLKKLAGLENRWARARETYQQEMGRLKERSRTKCHNCGKMTRISRS
jgi:hypothetical protein